jgi:hypothetical protein
VVVLDATYLTNMYFYYNPSSMSWLHNIKTW